MSSRFDCRWNYNSREMDGWMGGRGEDDEFVSVLCVYVDRSRVE